MSGPMPQPPGSSPTMGAPLRAPVLVNSALIHADYRETLAQCAEAGGADLVVTSPPYCDARTYGAGVAWTMADYQALGEALFAAMKPGGHCLMILDAPVREWRRGFGTERGLHPWRVMLDYADRVGFRVPDRLAYARGGVPGRFKGRFRNAWEPLLWFQKPGAEGYFCAQAILESCEPYAGGKTSTRRPDGRTRIYTRSGAYAREGLRFPTTLWKAGAFNNSEKHPATFSLAFAERAVLCFSAPGALVSDPFLGSGTTAVAALKHGRVIVGGDALCNAAGRPWTEIARARVARELPSVRPPELRTRQPA